MIGPKIGGMWFLDFSFCNIRSTGYPNKMLILQTGKFEIGDSSECFMPCSVLPSPNFPESSGGTTLLFILYFVFLGMLWFQSASGITVWADGGD